MSRIRNVVFPALGLLVACTTPQPKPADPDLVACDEVEDRVSRLDGVFTTHPGHRIALADPRLAGWDWRFHVFEDDEPYAFALPNGVVGVTTGLLALALNEAQHAGILFHEMAHVVHARPERAHLCAELLPFLSEGSRDGAISAPAFVDAVIALELENPYSPEEEEAADRDGLLLVAGAAHTPLGMIRVFERLAAQNAAAPPRLFLVHPPAKDRVAALRRHLAAAMTHYYASKHGGSSLIYGIDLRN